VQLIPFGHITVIRRFLAILCFGRFQDQAITNKQSMLQNGVEQQPQNETAVA
jgi:hypothetical protein